MIVSGRREKRIRGVGAAGGIVEGKAHVLDRRKARISKRYIGAGQVEREIRRIEEALAKAKADLKRIKEILAHEEIHEHSYILDSHLMILEDPMLLEAIRETIASGRKNAEWALCSAFENFKRMFDTVDNDYLKERKSDFDYLNNWVLKHLSGANEESLQSIREQVIVVAHYLSPADTAQMDRNKVIGFVTDIGGKTSHTAILARALKIPAVVGAEKATLEINTNDRIILDGMEGMVVVNPTRESVRQFRERKSCYDRLEKHLLLEKNFPAETLDGRRIGLLANIEMVEEARTVLECGAEGIGLYRTEFHCLSQGRIPEEEELFRAYRSVVEQVAPLAVTLRTFDFGSDKSPGLNHVSQEANPALGLRSIRYCLKETQVFKDQLKAILRASQYGNVRILFPMISGLSEFRRAMDVYQQSKKELRDQGLPFDPNIKIGIMVEVPSAALVADVFAKEVDFFSIGTNDLIQYCLAIDRVNKEVAYLYQPLHPAILRLLKLVVEAGHGGGIPVGMCGEMASDPRYIFVLLGFGFDQLSMVSSMVPWVKNIIRSSRHQDAEKLVKRMMDSRDSEENEELLTAWIKEKFPDLTDTILSVH